MELRFKSVTFNRSINHQFYIISDAGVGYLTGHRTKAGLFANIKLTFAHASMPSTPNEKKEYEKHLIIMFHNNATIIICYKTKHLSLEIILLFFLLLPPVLLVTRSTASWKSCCTPCLVCR